MIFVINIFIFSIFSLLRASKPLRAIPHSSSTKEGKNAFEVGSLDEERREGKKVSFIVKVDKWLRQMPLSHVTELNGVSLSRPGSTCLPIRRLSLMIPADSTCSGLFDVQCRKKKNMYLSEAENHNKQLRRRRVRE